MGSDLVGEVDKGIRLLLSFFIIHVHVLRVRVGVALESESSVLQSICS